MTGIVVLVVAVVVAASFGLYRAATDGRFRGTRRLAATPAGSARPAAGGPATEAAEPRPTTAWTHVSAALPDAVPGERATLLQFSSAFCAPCRATRRVLGEVAEVVPGVAHLEVDAEHHLELVRALDVTRTPTTLVLDASGAEVVRAAGAPRKESVLATLADVVG